MQLGLRGEALEAFGKRELLEVIDLSEVVAEQRPHASGGGFSGLVTPLERAYLPSDPEVRARVGLDTSGGD